MKTTFTRALVVTVALLCLRPLANAQELYVGANYHPHDSNLAQWQKDIQLMHDAGFKVVRMGHLAWDSYEPTEGHFDFAWFDQVMDLMDKAGIKVILDLAVRPAPIWLHEKFPAISITDAGGNRLYPNHRYMVDVGDPDYQKYALRYAEVLVKRYGKHPALLAFGLDNESGDGPISYSETVRQRFITWLQQKYSNVDNLNRAWAGQRWSRKIGKFEEVGLPMSGTISGPTERVLDFRRFISDEVSGFLFKLAGTVRANAPDALTTGNFWYYSDSKYFDYSALAYSGLVDRGGCGFYPGNSLINSGGLRHALFGMARIQFENTTPFWCTEFPTMAAVPGSMRKAAYASLLFGNQMVVGWTWQSMAGGEEQYLEGMMDWDGGTNRKYDEYKQIAAEFKKIGPYGFPYKPQAEIGLAFSFASQIASYSLPEQHDEQLQKCFDVISYRNLDSRVVELTRSELKYKLLIVPGVVVMDETSAAKIRDYISNGGTVIMTGNSAIVDEHGQVFTSTHPGRLADVFGIRIASFEEPAALNEISKLGLRGKKLRLTYGSKEIDTESGCFDVIEPRTAEVLGHLVGLDKDYPIITANKYGKGTAIYIGLPAKSEILDPMVDELIGKLAIKRGPTAPTNVMARFIDPKHVLYLNLNGESKTIELKGQLRSILHDADYTDKFTLPPYQPEFIEIK